MLGAAGLYYTAHANGLRSVGLKMHRAAALRQSQGSVHAELAEAFHLMK